MISRKWAFPALGLLIVLYVMVGTALAHSWYDFQCCNERDCRQTILHEVKRTDDGWRVSPQPGAPFFHTTTIPFDDKRVRRSMDPLIHICVRSQNVICLYVPEMGG